MDTKGYEQSKDFERNRAIFVLSSIDNVPFEHIAANFNLEIDQIKNIVAVHQAYEASLR